MSLNLDAHPSAERALFTAASAAATANVHIIDEHNRDKLQKVEELLVSVWGMSPHGAPIPFDLLRSISHAGCNVAAAYTPEGVLCGTAVAIVSPEGSVYSLIAGVLPGIADRGVGFALKQHQRAWSLARGLETMRWTFDPLVSRNARFNLTKLGAVASEYERNFYGEMQDELNANDQSDRLVVVWPLSSARSIQCSEGLPEEVTLPQGALDRVMEYGPDSQPALVQSEGNLWCRAPRDIIALRGTNPQEAALWRSHLRAILEAALASGYVASGVSRTGWYKLTPAAFTF